MIPVFLALAVAATPPPAARSARLQTGASRTALATVVDARNQPLVDLGPDEFVVREAGQLREVFAVRIADYPVVVLIDNGADARPDFEQIRQAAAQFIARLGQRPLVVGTLGDPLAMLTSFDDDRARLSERLAAVTAKPTGESRLLQGVANAARMLHETRSPFSAIVVISATPIDDSRNDPNDLLAPILNSGAIIHAVANRLVSNVGATGPLRLSETLRQLTEQTRGQFTTIYSAASYTVALDHLADRLAGEMMIEYIVPPGSSAGGDVKLGVRVPGAKVKGLGVTPR